MGLNGILQHEPAREARRAKNSFHSLTQYKWKDNSEVESTWNSRDLVAAQVTSDAKNQPGPSHFSFPAKHWWAQK